MWRRSRNWDPGKWSDRTDRPRVLIEDSDGAILSSCEHFLRREGFDVAVCRGPEGMGKHRCPLVTSGDCALAGGADVIYTSLRWHNADNRDVLQALRARYPRTPIVVEIPQSDVKRFADIMTGCQIVTVPSGSETMLKAIRNALESTPAL